MMRKTEIQFSDHKARCVFPDHRNELPQALSELNLGDHYPVIVLVGGFIQDQHEAVTQQAIDVVASCAEENCALIVCGGSDLGVMASIGRTRRMHGYKFPLLGINLESLVTWPKGPRSQRFLWWGKERFPLATGYSHFILVPGNEYGEDSPWIAEAASLLSKDNRSITILANGGNVTRKDIALSLENERAVIVLAGTGRLADEMSNQSTKSTLITIIPADNENALRDFIQLAIGNQN